MIADSSPSVTKDTPQLLAKVVVLAPMPEALDYLIPEGLSISEGDHVSCPLGHSKTRGIVIGFEAHEDETRLNLKALFEKLPDPPVPEQTLNFWLWAAKWTMTPPGVFISGCIRALRSAKPQTKTVFRLTGKSPAKMTKARERVMAEAVMDMTAQELAFAAGVSVGVITALETEGVFSKHTVRADKAMSAPDPDFAPAALNEGQKAALSLISPSISERKFSPVLLDGVTGSGKTEVYLELVAQLLRQQPDRQCLILLPEIALTQAVLTRLRARFGADVAQWHANITNSERRRVWDGVAKGEIRLVIGARSALFLPFSQLGLIVVDEEHDSSYKQEEGVRYQARDLAVFRARLDGATIVLASATPSLETLNHAQSGRYAWVRLESRFGTAVLPDIELIDLKHTPPEKGQWLSPPLIRAMVETLGRKEQVLLFLNRRGYAPVVLCKSCGERLTAPGTDSTLVEHRSKGRLVCHLTGFSMKKPAACPHCGAKDSLTSVGPGVERILEEVSSLFPDHKAVVFSSDTTPDAQSSAQLIADIEDGHIDIVIATQAAAKGHNFPNLTLVGVVDADLGLKGGDLRAAERTFQLLSQATGRAGRALKKGRALLQTYTPEHPVMQTLKCQDRDGFYAYELMAREMVKFPPFGRLAALILSAKDYAVLSRYGRDLRMLVPASDGVEVFGPADAPLSLLKGQFRQRFLIRADRNRDLQAFVEHWLSGLKKPAQIRTVIDIEPYNFM